MRRRFLGGAVAVAALLAYTNAVPNGFVFDDQSTIVDNPWLEDPRRLGEIFTSNFWGFFPGYVSNFYRPFVHFVWMVLFQAFGLKSWPFHLVNVLLHAGNSVLVFLVVDRLLAPSPSSSAVASRAGRTSLPALAAGLLFAVHPIHTEAVAWVSGLAEVGFTFFVLLVLFQNLRSGSASLAGAICSALFFLAALLFKETAVVVLLVLVAHDLLWSRPQAARQWAERYAPLAAALAVYAALRFALMGGLGNMPRLPPYGTMEAPAYAANVLRFFALYLWKLLLPARLNAVHDFTPVRSLSEGPALFGPGGRA